MAQLIMCRPATVFTSILISFVLLAAHGPRKLIYAEKVKELYIAIVVTVELGAILANIELRLHL